MTTQPGQVAAAAQVQAQQQQQQQQPPQQQPAQQQQQPAQQQPPMMLQVDGTGDTSSDEDEEEEDEYDEDEDEDKDKDGGEDGQVEEVSFLVDFEWWTHSEYYRKIWSRSYQQYRLPFPWILYTSCACATLLQMSFDKMLLIDFKVLCAVCIGCMWNSVGRKLSLYISICSRFQIQSLNLSHLQITDTRREVKQSAACCCSAREQWKISLTQGHHSWGCGHRRAMFNQLPHPHFSYWSGITLATAQAQ